MFPPDLNLKHSDTLIDVISYLNQNRTYFIFSLNPHRININNVIIGYSSGLGKPQSIAKRIVKIIDLVTTARNKSDKQPHKLDQFQ